MFGMVKQDSLLKKFLKSSVLLVIFLLPLIFSAQHAYFYATPKYVFLAVLGAVCFALLGFYLLEARFQLNKESKMALGLVTALIIWLFISSLFGAEPLTSFWSNFGRHTGFLAYFFAFIFFFASFVAFDKNTYLAPLRALALGGALAAISVYFSGALFDINLFFLKNSGNGGTFGNTTYAAIFLAFSLFSASILFFRDNKKWLWGGCFLLILFSPIFINFKAPYFLGEARAGTFSILLGLAFSLILYFYFSGKKIYSILAKISLVLMFLAGAYLAVGFLTGESKLYQSFAIEKEGVRFIYWDMALAGIAERPALGFGLENFGAFHNKHFNPVLLSPEYPSESWADKPHNVMLEIAFSSGILGLVLYLSLLAFAFISLIRKAQASEGADRKTAALFFGLLVSYIFQLLFAFDTATSLLAFFVTLALVFVFIFGTPVLPEKKKLNQNAKIFAGFLIIPLSIAMLYYFGLRVGQESKMIRQLNKISINDRVARFEKTFARSPAGTLATEAQHIDFLVEKYKKEWAGLSPLVKQGAITELKSLLAYSQKRSDKYPSDLRFALVTAKLANSLVWISSGEDPVQLLKIAKKYGARAVNNSPLGEKGYQVLAETFLIERKFDSAMKFAEMIIALNPKAPEAHDLAIFIAGVEKNPKLVEEKTKNAQSFIPGYEYKTNP